MLLNSVAIAIFRERDGKRAAGAGRDLELHSQLALSNPNGLHCCLKLLGSVRSGFGLHSGRRHMPCMFVLQYRAAHQCSNVPHPDCKVYRPTEAVHRTSKPIGVRSRSSVHCVPRREHSRARLPRSSSARPPRPRHRRWAAPPKYAPVGATQRAIQASARRAARQQSE